MGSANETDIYYIVKNNVNDNICLITDIEFTLNANEQTDIADYVIGSGKRFMESAVHRKVMFCIISLISLN